eukprot:1600878-Pleurochrysis_carterae.AAC.1
MTPAAYAEGMWMLTGAPHLKLLLWLAAAVTTVPRGNFEPSVILRRVVDHHKAMNTTFSASGNPNINEYHRKASNPISIVPSVESNKSRL